MPSSVTTARRRSVGLGCLAAFIFAACGTATGSPGPESVGASVGSPQPSVARAASPGSGASPAAIPSAGALGDRLVATVDGVGHPCAMAATSDAVWVTGNQPSTLVRIDPANNEIVERVALDGAACGIAIGDDGRVWVALLQAGEVVVIDPVTGAVEATVGELGGQLWDLKAGFGSIWVVDRTNRELLRIDPASATVIARVPIGRSGSGLAIVDGAVWVVDDADSTVRVIDPATNGVTDTVAVGLGAAWFVDDGSDLMVTDHRHGTAATIDVDARKARDPVTGLREPLDGTVLAGRAYIPDGRGRALAEIDLASGSIAAVDTLPGAQQPFVAEVAFGDVWVLDFGGERLWRIRP